MSLTLEDQRFVCIHNNNWLAEHRESDIFQKTAIDEPRL